MQNREIGPETASCTLSCSAGSGTVRPLPTQSFQHPTYYRSKIPNRISIRTYRKRQSKRRRHSSIPLAMADMHALQVLDPISLLLSENSRSGDQPIIPLCLRPDTEAYFVMERGPRYRAYEELRQAKLMRKHVRQPETDSSDPIQTPPRKQVRLQGSSVGGREKSSILAQSVPNFSSSVIRKENKKPVNAPPPLPEMTPTSKNWPTVNTAAASSARGYKSANAGEKKGRTVVRKSYACVEELKGLSSASGISIGGDRIGGRRLRGTRRTVLGSRQI